MNRPSLILAGAVVAVAAAILFAAVSVERQAVDGPTPAPTEAPAAAPAPPPAEAPPAVEPPRSGAAAPVEPPPTAVAAAGTPPAAGPGASPEPPAADETPMGGPLAEIGEAAGGAQPAAMPFPTGPSFDSVRVSRYGSAVVAGRAAPRAEVRVLDAGTEIGRVEADEAGGWVFVLTEPLRPGAHEFALSVSIPGQDRPLASEAVVVVFVPDLDAEPVQAQQEPFAVLVPRRSSGPTTVLQAPGSVVEDTAAQGDSPLGAEVGADEAPTTPVSIDLVDYDQEGRVAISGRAGPRARLRLYLDNELVGTGQADVTGSYRVEPDRTVAPGVYRLRLDAVDDAGVVLARSEAPFQRTEFLEPLPDATPLVVQPGNSLWRIAREVEDESMQYTVIYQADRFQVRDPDLVYPGQLPVDGPGGDPD